MGKLVYKRRGDAAPMIGNGDGRGSPSVVRVDKKQKDV